MKQIKTQLHQERKKGGWWNKKGAAHPLSQFAVAMKMMALEGLVEMEDEMQVYQAAS